MGDVLHPAMIRDPACSLPRRNTNDVSIDEIIDPVIGRYCLQLESNWSINRTHHGPAGSDFSGHNLGKLECRFQHPIRMATSTFSHRTQSVRAFSYLT
jgi:hypothetical protein